MYLKLRFYHAICEVCTQIANCPTEFCTTSLDQKCDNCDGEYGASYGSAYKKSDDQRLCIKQCSWRTDSNACYPGSCTNAQCTCTAGFSGTDCRTSELSVISMESVLHIFKSLARNLQNQTDVLKEYNLLNCVIVKTKQNKLFKMRFFFFRKWTQVRHLCCQSIVQP